MHLQTYIKHIFYMCAYFLRANGRLYICLERGHNVIVLLTSVHTALFQAFALFKYFILFFF